MDTNKKGKGKLTQDQLDKINQWYNETESGITWEKKAHLLGQEFGVSERTIRRNAVKIGCKEKEDGEPEQYLLAKQRVYDGTKKRFIITWAQSSTTVHEKFYKKMVNYAEHIDATIHIILGRYKNPTSLEASANTKNKERWSDDVMKYADANRHDIHKYVSIMSDIKIQPTATNPMSSMAGVSGINSCVFGSPRVQMEVIPALEGMKPKIMMTTGAVTLKNYTDTKAGKKGEFHHTLGFVIIEIKDDNTFFIRQVTADDETGDFTDLIYRSDDNGVSVIEEADGIVLGDLHYGQHDQTVLTETLDFMSVVRPRSVVLHDVFDGYSISHHEMKDPFLQYAKELSGKNDLGKEIEDLIDGLKDFEGFDNVVIVRSNHDDFVDRWLKNDDWKKQPTPKNSRLYMQLSDLLLEQYSNGDAGYVKGVIPALINKSYPQFKTLGKMSSYTIGGFECGQHGDVGSGGSRGSIQNFRRLNTKIVVGHYHTPARFDGALAVGTSTKLRMGYNQGPSSWLHAHVLIHTDGKAQHIIFNDGEFTTFDY